MKDQHLRVTVYSADKGEGNIFHHLRDIAATLPDAHELGYRLFKRNVKALYRQSFLGFAWMLLPPLVTAALWIFLRGNVMQMDDTPVPYPVFVFLGTMLWQVFTESVNAPLKNVMANKSLLVKINIPREGLLLSGIYEVVLNLLIKLVLITAIFIGFGQSVGMSLLLVPAGIFSIVVVGFSIGLILVPLGMLYTDIQKGVTLILPFLMYLTPIVYPEPKAGFAAAIMKVNPLATVIPVTRDLFTSVPVHDWNLFISYTVAGFFLFVLGLVVYRISMPMIIERIGS